MSRAACAEFICVRRAVVINPEQGGLISIIGQDKSIIIISVQSDVLACRSRFDFICSVILTVIFQYPDLVVFARHFYRAEKSLVIVVIRISRSHSQRSSILCLNDERLSIQDIPNAGIRHINDKLIAVLHGDVQALFGIKRLQRD